MTELYRVAGFHIDRTQQGGAAVGLSYKGWANATTGQLALAV